LFELSYIKKTRGVYFRKRIPTRSIGNKNEQKYLIYKNKKTAYTPGNFGLNYTPGKFRLNYTPGNFRLNYTPGNFRLNYTPGNFRLNYTPGKFRLNACSKRTGLSEMIVGVLTTCHTQYT
jgi:hypothetical protein